MSSSPSPSWAMQIIKTSDEKPESLAGNPDNWRIHPWFQQQALVGVLETIGMLEPVLVNETTGNVLDGHLRVLIALAQDRTTIPVNWVRLSPEHEAAVLATIDTTTELATPEQAVHAELLDRARKELPQLRATLQTLRDRLHPELEPPMIDHMQQGLAQEEPQDDTPAATPIRQITLLYPLQEYREVVAALATLRAEYAVATDAEVVLQLLGLDAA